MPDDGDLDGAGPPGHLCRILAECLKRLDAGERPTVSDLAAAHPEYRAEVEQFLTDYCGLEDLVAPLRADTMPDPAGANDGPTLAGRFAEYELLGVLGRGGMAVVYEARHLRLDRVVALKMVDLTAPSAARRFRLEAQLVATLDHPGVVPIYDVGECDGRPFYTMKLLDGGSLADALAGGRWAAGGEHRRAAEVVAAVARAVHYAHDRGIFHRDLKPANILLDGDGRPHVADFGLARRAAAEPGATQSGAVVGTPAYMPPEQAMGRTAGSAAADVYALGAILYELLTGRPVHPASTPIEAILRVIGSDPVDPRRLDRSIPRDLETVCLKCLDRDPGRRYPSAAALADDLARWLAGEPIAARPVRVPERAARWARRHPATVRVAAAVAAVTAAALWVGGYAVQRERAAAAEARVRAESDARARIEQEHYFRTIALAARERAAGSPGRAEQLLAACPPALRGWEWHYLRRQPLDPSAPLRASSHLFALAASPDGRRLAAGGSDGTVDVWDLGPGTSARLAAHQGRQVRGLAFNRDGSRLASAGWDGRVVLWDAATGGRVRSWEFKDAAGRPLDAFSVAFSPDGRTLAASVGHEIRRWDVATGEPDTTPLGHGNVVRRIAFAPDGRDLAAVDDDGRLKVWDLGRRRPRLDVAAHPHLVFDLAYSADGRRLVTAGGQFYMHGDAGQVKVWDASDGSPVREFVSNAGAFYAAAFTPDAGRIMAGGEDGRVRVWDAATGEEALTLRGHAEAVWGLAFSPDGRRMYTAGGDHHVRLWDATPLPGFAPPPGGAAPHELRVTAAAFSPGGDVLVTAGMGGATHLRHPSTGEVVRAIPPLRGQIHALAFSPDGERLATAVWRRPDDPAADSGVVVRDTRTWEVVARPALKTFGVLGLSYSPDGRMLAAADDHGIAAFDTATWGVVWHHDHTCLVTAVAFGRAEIACADANGLVTFRDPRTGAARPGAIAAHAGRVAGLAYNPDRSRLASAGLDGAVRVWDVASRTQLSAPAGHPGGAYTVAFTPEDGRLVSGGNDGVVRLWDARTGRELRAIVGHTDAVHAVAVHPSGASLASGGRDRDVRLWRLGTKRGSD